ERLHDLDALLLADRDAVDPGVRVDGEVERLRELLHPSRGRALVEQDPGLHRLRSEHDVLGDGHHRDEHEMLMHHPDPGLDGVLVRVDAAHSVPILTRETRGAGTAARPSTQEIPPYFSAAGTLSLPAMIFAL